MKLGPSWAVIGLGALIGLLDLGAGLFAPFLDVTLGWQPVALGLGAAALAIGLLWPNHDRWLGLGSATTVVLSALLAFLAAEPFALQAAGGAALISALIGLRLRRLTLPLPSTKGKVEVERDGKTRSVPLEEIVTGDRVIVTDGELIRVDGVIERGQGFVDETAVTGSGLPAPKREGDKVYSGTLSAAPELVIRAERPAVESLLWLKARAGQHLLESTLEARAWGRGLAALLFVIAALAAGFAAWRGIPLPRVIAASAFVLLLVPAALPSLVLLFARKQAQRLAYDGGMVISRAKDLERLAKVRRWQLEPGLLSAPGAVEAVIFEDTPGETLIVVAEALLEDNEGPERTALAAARNKQKLERLQGAAFKEAGGVRFGTVNGRRWFMGSVDSVKAELKLEVAESLRGTVQFLDDRSSLVLLIGRPEDGILGALGIQLEVVPEMKNAAAGLEATLLGGLPDQIRQNLALLAGIACDGPPPTARDAAILSESGIPPSAGHRVRVVPLSAEALLKAEAAPRIFSPAVANLPGIARGLKQLRRRAQLEIGILIVAAIVGAAAAGFLAPGVAAVLGAALFLFHTR